MFALRKIIVLVTVLLFLLPHGLAYADAGLMSSTPDKCKLVSPSQMRPELTQAIQDFFEAENSFNFDAKVGREWKLLKIDKILNDSVSAAVTEIGVDTKWQDKFMSSWNSGKAEQLAAQVISQTFDNPDLKRSLQRLANNVGRQVADEIELATVQSSSYGMQCLQTFIGDQYSTTFLDLFNQKAEESAQQGSVDFSASFTPESKKYLLSRNVAAVGIGTFIIGRITREVTKKFAERVIGQVGKRLLGRLGAGAIPFVGEIVGVGLLAADVAQSFSGSFEEIETQLKSPNVKNSLRQSISDVLQDEIGGQSSQIASEISNELYAEWLDFQKDYRETLNLASEIPEFKQLLTEEGDMPKVTSLVGIALNNMGRRKLIDAIQDGSFAQALNLPIIARPIIQYTGSIQEAVSWSKISGNFLERVVDLEIYKHLSLEGLEHRLLVDLLALEDADAISKMSLLQNSEIQQLLAISSPNLIPLAKVVSAQDLQRLSGYIEQLDKSETNDLIRFLLDDSKSTIKNTDVMTHIVQSGNISRATKFWQRQTSPLSLAFSLWPIAMGEISWRLAWVKYGSTFLGEAFVAIAVALSLTLGLGFKLYGSILDVKYKQAKLAGVPQDTEVQDSDENNVD